MTLNEKFRNVTGLSLDVEEMIANCPVEEKEKLYNELENNGIHTLFDDRTEISIGAKIKDSRLVGVSYIAIVGNSVDKGFIELENIKTGEKNQIRIEEFVNVCKSQLQ